MAEPVLCFVSSVCAWGPGVQSAALGNPEKQVQCDGEARAGSPDFEASLVHHGEVWSGTWYRLLEHRRVQAAFVDGEPLALR